MNGGEIHNNTARFGGGGVSGSLTMNGGEIHNNTAAGGGGVSLPMFNGFTMNGGEIRDNTAGYDGGGIRSNMENAIIINAGEIRGNTAGRYGGGIHGGQFTMEDGKINGNTASRGGGVQPSSGVHTMNGGEINGNTAIGGGGVVLTGLNPSFTMNGGEINGNIAHTESTLIASGGGVSVSGGTFTLNEGEINGNTASSESAALAMGGGVIIVSLGTFIMNGGEINGNTAGSDGGAVNVHHSGTFIMNDGQISKNVANNNGGAFYILRTITQSGALTINKGIISDNIANNGGGLFTAHRNLLAPHIIIENEVIFTGNVARHGLFIDNPMAARNPQIIPGTVSILDTHAFTNYDINVEALSGNQMVSVTFAVRNGEGGTLTAGGNTVSGAAQGQVIANPNETVNLTAVPATGWEIEAWYINNVRQTGPISNILDHIAAGVGPYHIEILFVEEDLLFNLALRTFISQTETNGVTNNTNRAPIVSMPSVFTGELIYTFPVDKSVNPVQMTNGSIMIQTIRIFNEGTIAGYVNEIVNDIPAGLEFLPMHNTNVSYEWIMYDVSGQVTTDVSEAVEIRTRYLENNSIGAFDPDLGVIVGNPDYRDIQVAFRVTYEGGTGRIIVSRSEIYDAEAYGGGTIGYINLLDEENDTEYMYVVRTDDNNGNGNGNKNNGSNNGNDDDEDDGEVKGEYRPEEEKDNQGKGNAVSTNDPISSARYIVLIAIAMTSLIVLLREKRK